jgi:hypothetical protein
MLLELLGRQASSKAAAAAVDQLQLPVLTAAVTLLLMGWLVRRLL